MNDWDIKLKKQRITIRRNVYLHLKLHFAFKKLL